MPRQPPPPGLLELAGRAQWEDHRLLYFVASQHWQCPWTVVDRCRSGPICSTSDNALYVTYPQAAADFSGQSVASAGDVDGDGLDDLLIGAGGNSQGGINSGKTYLMLGSTIATGITAGTTSWNLSQADASFVGVAGYGSGRSVASAGDVDGDGLSDILIGGTERGWLLLGAQLASSAQVVLIDAHTRFVRPGKPSSRNNCVFQVSTAGDVDGDLLSDLIIGCQFAEYSSVKSGAAYVFLGSSLTLYGGFRSLYIADAILGGSGFENYWAHVHGGGDVNGDGVDDIVFGKSTIYDGAATLFLSPY